MEHATSTHGPVDQNDPKWKPIHGVTLDKYAELTAIMAKHNITAMDKIKEFVEAEGVAPQKWHEVTVEWTKRMDAEEEVKTRYGRIYAHFNA